MVLLRRRRAADALALLDQLPLHLADLRVELVDLVALALDLEHVPLRAHLHLVHLLHLRGVQVHRHLAPPRILRQLLAQDLGVALHLLMGFAPRRVAHRDQQGGATGVAPRREGRGPGSASLCE